MTDETSTRMPSGKTALTTYAILLVATIALAVLGLAFGDSGDLILTVPVIGILALTLFSERHALHLPPLTVVMIWVSMLLTIVSRVFLDGGLISIAASILTGINLTLIGLIIVFILLRSMPGTRNENPQVVATIASCVAIAVFMLMNLFQFAMTFVFDFIKFTVVEKLMAELCWVIIGTIITNVLFIEFRDSKLFKYTVNTFLENNSETLGLEERERLDLQDLIAEGESDRLEFKSTVRTNLETGETDKRMEKAVLKTIVAFLNTDGGTLLIGVSDDGEILGADVDSFDSVDRMNLHMTNMISSAIGNGFIPYINFKPVLIDGKYVVRVRCDKAEKAVFLREGKSEQFYVRSGPSSVELTGMNLVNYVNNRNKKGKRFGSL
ncbi:MAG: ATP-binding protein [Candidatus Methanomethylophilaceae archaeon]|nr:ATP-binding protein [Candidatus Methanomethylophilaceae archaeon]